MTAVAASVWRADALGEALDLLLRHAGLSAETHRPPPAPSIDADAGAVDRWLAAALEPLGLEAEPVDASYAEARALAGGCAPGLLRVTVDGEARFLAVARAGRRAVTIIGADRRIVRVQVEDVRDLLCAPLETLVSDSVDRVLARTGVSERRRGRARAALMAERLGARRVGGCWVLRPRPGAPLAVHLREEGIGALAVRLLAAHAGQYALWIAAWWMIGAGALSGRIDGGWLAGWMLALATAIPLRALALAWQGRLGVAAGLFLKRRLLDGALRMRSDDIRHQGAGQLLGRVMESDVVEHLAVSGGLLALLGSMELVAAVLVLAAGAGGWTHVLLLLGWTVLVVALGWRYARVRRRWTAARLEMTHDLVERMVGYRTRLAQEPAARRHDAEEEQLDRYLHLSAGMDGAATMLSAVAARGWLVVGLLGLAPAFVWGRASAGELAVGLGGVLLAWQSLGRLAPVLAMLPDAAIAWERVGEFFRASARSDAPGAWEASLVDGSADREMEGDRTMDHHRSLDRHPSMDRDRGIEDDRSSGLASSIEIDLSTDVHFSIDRDESTDPLRSTDSIDDSPRRPAVLEAAGVAYRYSGRGAAVFEGVDLRIGRGDRVLLEGPSGAGKSTLAALLAGLREPDAGSLTLGGLDRWTVGAQAWRRRVAAAPQFHENHVLTDTFAFNLLMGRGWPASDADLAEAEQVCRALGMGELLDRMPSGMMQMVGEGGWRLSHGERSRLFLARALLQRGDLLVLDESFAALDPESLARCLRVVIERAPALVVVAHP